LEKKTKLFGLPCPRLLYVLPIKKSAGTSNAGRKRNQVCGYGYGSSSGIFIPISQPFVFGILYITSTTRFMKAV